MGHSISMRHAAAAALATAMAGAVPAVFAQGSVTLFGVMDAALRQTSLAGGAKVNSLASGGLAGSRIGVRGVEDMGGGLEASFWLEADIAADTGSANAAAFWSRRSTVSIASRSVGELRLGRDYAPLFIRQYVRYDPFLTNGIASNGTLYLSTPSLLGSGSGVGVRADNVLKLVLPGNLGGVYGELMRSLPEGRSTNQHLGGVIGWDKGPMNISLGFGNTHDTADTAQIKLKTLGGAYDFNWARFSVLYQAGRYKARKQDTLGLGATAPIGQWRLKAAYVRANQSGSGSDANDATQWSAGFVYSLSKRSSLYGTFSRIDNKGRQNFGFGGVTPAAGQDMRGIEFGINHFF